MECNKCDRYIEQDVKPVFVFDCLVDADSYNDYESKFDKQRRNHKIASFLVVTICIGKNEGNEKSIVKGSGLYFPGNPSIPKRFQMPYDKREVG